MVGYYDVILGAIPASLIGLTLLGLQAGLPATVAIPIGTGVSMALMAHAMFVNGPVERPGQFEGDEAVPEGETQEQSGVGATGATAD